MGVLAGLSMIAVSVLGAGSPALAAPAVALRPAARIPAGPDTPGTQLWVSRYNGSGNGPDHAYAVQVSPDGSKVFVTGESYSAVSGSGYDSVTVAYDASTAASLWSRRYNGPYNGDDHSYALSVSPDGSKVFVTGDSIASTGTHFDSVTVAYATSTGAQLWVKRYAGTGNGAGTLAAGVSSDGSTVFVTGHNTGSTSSDDYLTVAYAAPTGAVLWTKRYNGPGNGYDSASALGVSPDGSKVFVTGYSTGSTSPDYATVAYDASTGAQLWAKRYNGPGDNADGASALAVSPDGSRVFVTGQSLGAQTYEYATVAYNSSTGATLWAKLYKGPANGDAYASALSVSPDGSKVFVTGQNAGTSSDDYATVAYVADTGARLWAKRYNGTGDSGDYATALGVSPDGSTVFVTGESTASAGTTDYVTFAYDTTTGATLWARRYNGPAHDNDRANALAVSPDGSKVFVTGRSAGSTSLDDYATLAYSVA
jgi:lipocalin